MDKIICKISIGNGWLDDDYTIYQSGKVLREFDQSSFKPNQIHETDLKSLPNSKKERLLEKCPIEFKEAIKKLMYD